MVSVLVHTGAAIAVGGSKPPDFAFEFEIPIEVELGMADEMTLTAQEAAGVPESAAVVEAEGTSGQAASMLSDAGVDAGLEMGADAGPEDAGRDQRLRDAGADGGDAADAGVEDEGVDEGADEDSAGDEEEGEARRIPPGAQIALRMDVTAIQGSPLAPHVRRLLTNIPDWDLLLNGSGIEPLRDLERLLIATPNLQRQNFVLAGRHAHPERGRAFIDETVTRMHEARGRPVRWRQVEGVDVVDWPNVDRTPRVLAVVGPHHFVICRERDLPRVLAIAQTRAERAAEEAANEAEAGEETPAAPLGTMADALLSMDEGSALSFEVEGIHRFVRRAAERNPDRPTPDIRVVPRRISLSMRDTGSGVRMQGFGAYRNAEDAEAGRAFAQGELDTRIDAIPVIFRGAVPEIALGAEGPRMTIQINATNSQAVMGFRFVEGWLRNRRERRGGAGTMRASAMGRTTSMASERPARSSPMTSAMMGPSTPSMESSAMAPADSE
ncbi:MAG: hypothetical protein AAF645_17220 [Myxococcota bacterium]